MSAVISAVVVAAIGVGYGVYSTESARSDAKDISRANAAAAAAQTAEEAKRLEAENARIESLARARASASGVGGVSSNIYLTALEKSGREEVDWLKEVGVSAYARALSEGEVAASKARASSVAGAGKLVGAGLEIKSLTTPKTQPTLTTIGNKPMTGMSDMAWGR
jgi:hypothetical protein